MRIELDYHATLGADNPRTARDLRLIADMLDHASVDFGFQTLESGTLHVWERLERVTVDRDDARVAVEALRGQSVSPDVAARIEAAL